jgi:tight adherence protein B
MNRDFALIAVLGLALLALLLAVLAVAHSGDGRLLAQRLRAVAPKGSGEDLAPVLPSIRLRNTDRAGLRLRLLRALGHEPELSMPGAMPVPFVVFMAAVLGVIIFLGTAGRFGLPIGLLCGLAAALGAARFVFGRQRARCADALFRQIPDALGLVVRAIRAGLPLAEALRSVGREMPSPTRDEFSRVAGEMAIGRPVEDALHALARRTGLKEYAFLAVTLGLQSQTGGSLAETLDNLADIVRKRVAMAKRAQALAAEANLQAYLLIALPFVAGLAMSVIQPLYIQAFTEDPRGQWLLVAGLFFMTLGMLTIRWLIRQASRD